MTPFARFAAAFLLSALFATARAASGAPVPVPLDHLPALSGGYVPLVEEASGRTYHVYVRLPEGYDDAPEQAWPVVYLLDGDSLFPLLAPTHLFLHYDEQLPEAIVVGIAYGGFDPAVNKRNVDFTGQGADTRPGEGGAAAFHAFLAGRVLPEVEGRYRADPARRILVGQSRAGYFVLWSALRAPDLFWGRIASNPSFDPAREQLYGAPAAHARDGLRVAITSGARDTAERMRNAADWRAAWSARDDAPWEIEQIVLPEGTHAASIGEAYRRAMRWLFRAPTIGERREATLFWSQAEREAGFRNMQALFPSDIAAAGGRVRDLPPGAPLALPGGEAWLDDYMRRHHVAGLMVLHDGRVRLQRHGLGFGPDQRWESYSVAKSVTSTLLGIAIREGHVRGLDDPLPAYVPELAGSAYADVTVGQLLTMTSGVRWNEDYADPASDVARMYLGACVDGQAHALSYLRALPREHPPGTHWNYNTAETDLLGLVVQRATGRPLAHYLSDAIWTPYGMADDATWIRDECDGSNTGGSGLSASLGDYARLGQFMLEGGRIDGEQVIAEAWMQGAVRGQDSEGAPERGYGYLWWTDADGSYMAAGIFGQMLYVDPSRRLVIAQLAAWPQATSSGLVAARRAMVDAVKQAVDADGAK